MGAYSTCVNVSRSDITRASLENRSRRSPRVGSAPPSGRLSAGSFFLEARRTGADGSGRSALRAADARDAARGQLDDSAARRPSRTSTNPCCFTGCRDSPSPCSVRRKSRCGCRARSPRVALFWLTRWTGEQLFDERIGVRGWLMLATLPLTFMLGSIGVFDMVFTAFLFGAIAFALVAALRSRPRLQYVVVRVVEPRGHDEGTGRAGARGRVLPRGPRVRQGNPNRAARRCGG